MVPKLVSAITEVVVVSEANVEVVLAAGGCSGGSGGNGGSDGSGGRGGGIISVGATASEVTDAGSVVELVVEIDVSVAPSPGGLWPGGPLA